MLPPSRTTLDIDSLCSITEEQREIVSDLRGLNPTITAATFGGLLTLPELQSNCLRLEMLVHLAVAHCAGRASPSRAFILRAFERLGQGNCGHAEDPSEDVFVATVHTATGNYRIFQGIRESPAFCLQRVLNVIETMPGGEPYNGLRSAVDALLRVSEAVIARSQLPSGCLGREVPEHSLPRNVADRLSQCRSRVRFSHDELSDLNLSLADLAKFIFPHGCGLLAPTTQLGHSPLERLPILANETTLYLVLPTAVATAITRFVVEQVIALGKNGGFERAFVRETIRELSRTPLIGDPEMATLPFLQLKSGYFSAFVTEIEPGKSVHSVLFVDGLEDFPESSMAGANAAPEALGNQLDDYLRRVTMNIESDREGLLLIVMAGLGRTLVCPIKADVPPGWSLEFLTAADFVTLSHLHQFNWGSLWNLLDSRRRLEAQHVELFNVSGLLNLAAWADRKDGRLISPDLLPDEKTGGSTGMIWIPQNALRQARHQFETDHSARRALNIDNRWAVVRKRASSFFPEDNRKPFFVSDSSANRKLQGVYIHADRPWWMEISASDESTSAIIVDYWGMLRLWLGRAVPVLERAYGNALNGPLLFDFRFGHLRSSGPPPQRQMDESELRGLIQVTARRGSADVVLTIADGFEDGFRRPENLAERLIVEAMVEATALVAGDGDRARMTSCVEVICPNDQARHVHVFEARTFRDYLVERLRNKPTLVDRFDSAASRIGLGWKRRHRSDGGEIRGIEPCTAFLNETVQAVMNEMCVELRQFGRQSFVTAVMHNFERAAHDREHWRRTAQANFSLREDQRATMNVIAQHEAELNACFLASRILMEAAHCECPVEGSRELGKLELSRLMAQANTVFQLRGWSDAIHWGAVEPYIRITDSGDVQMNQSFFDSVYEPFGRMGTESLIQDAADEYPDHYAPRRAAAEPASVMEAEFLAAWVAEVGVSIDIVRQFLDRIEDVAIERSEVVLALKTSELLELFDEPGGTPRADIELVLAALSLPRRPRWREAPAGYEDRDWYPWRFRRRLSVLRQPFFPLDDEDDPLILIAPGIAREAFAYTIGSFYEGEVPQWQARSKEMQYCLGSANHRQRQRFSTQVGQRLTELGWQVDLEVKVTKLMRKALDRNYGDVDVLAWRQDSPRILIVECKDLQYRKTLGEVAEQLADYRGQLKANGKRDDLLKHLDRVALLKANADLVARHVNRKVDQIEGHLVFKNPVPMRYAWDHMEGQIRLSLFDDLESL